MMHRFTKSFFATGALLMACLLCSFTSRATVVDTGTIVKDITFKDVNGKEFTLYSYLDQGYTVVIEFGLTTCPICWEFSNSEIFERLYKEYGPKGTVKSKKIMPMFIECNPQTTDADLKGTGSKTMGDWVSGKSYPIVDLTTEQAIPVLGNFFKNTAVPFNTPTFVVICPDRKVVHTGEGLFGIQEQQAWQIMEKRCAAKGTDIGNFNTPASVKIYPNPATEQLNIQLSVEQRTTVTAEVVDMMGRVVRSEKLGSLQGEERKSIPLQGLTAGSYVLVLASEQGKTQQFLFTKQ